MRTLYDRYGRDAVLNNNLMLVNGLGDLVENSQKLRNQMKMALDAGVGRLYLDQLNGTGAPDTAFDQRVRAMMTDDAGLSDKVAAEIAGYFDVMIGWRSNRPDPRPEAPQYVPPRRYTPNIQPNATIDADASTIYQSPEQVPEQQQATQQGKGGKGIGCGAFLLVMILGFLLFGLLNDPPNEGGQSSNTVTKAPSVSMPTLKPRKKSIPTGTWIDRTSQRATMVVTKQYGNTYSVRISWADSAEEWNEWTFSGEYTELLETLSYSNCVMTWNFMDSTGERYEVQEYENGSGTLTYRNGYLYWYDYENNAGKNCVFEPN